MFRPIGSPVALKRKDESMTTKMNPFGLMFSAVKSERDYQRKRRGNNPMSVGDFTLLLTEYFDRTRAAWSKEAKPETSALHPLRKMAAIALAGACLGESWDEEMDHLVEALGQVATSDVAVPEVTTFSLGEYLIAIKDEIDEAAFTWGDETTDAPANLPYEDTRAHLWLVLGLCLSAMHAHGSLTRGEEETAKFNAQVSAAVDKAVNEASQKPAAKVNGKLFQGW